MRPSSINVLYLTMNPNRQSTTVPTEGWFRFLPAEGLRPVLVSREAGSFDRWARDRGIPAYTDPLPFPDKRAPLPFARSLWRLRRLVRTHRIDVIHCNEQDIAPTGRYLSWLCRIPYVVSVHFAMSQGYCQWAFGGSKGPALMFFVTQRNLDLCASALEGTVPAEKRRVLHNGLDLESYRPSADLRRAFRLQHGIDEDAVVIGAACAFRSRKQLEHLFDAAARITDARLRVLLAGFPVADEADYADQLLKRAQEQLGNRLCFVGKLDDMRGFSNALDIFVNTSRDESFGLGVLEALACGCPVVGYDSNAVDEVVLPDGGEIVEQDNLDLLTAAIERWINDPQRLLNARLMARRQAERFDLRRLALQLWGEYITLLNPSRVS